LPLDRATLDLIRERTRAEAEAAEAERSRKRGWLTRASQREFGGRAPAPAPADPPQDEGDAPVRRGRISEDAGLVPVRLPSRDISGPAPVDRAADDQQSLIG